MILPHELFFEHPSERVRDLVSSGILRPESRSVRQDGRYQHDALDVRSLRRVRHRAHALVIHRARRRVHLQRISRHESRGDDDDVEALERERQRVDAARDVDAVENLHPRQRVQAELRRLRRRSRAGDDRARPARARQLADDERAGLARGADDEDARRVRRARGRAVERGERERERERDATRRDDRGRVGRRGASDGRAGARRGRSSARDRRGGGAREHRRFASGGVRDETTLGIARNRSESLGIARRRIARERNKSQNKSTAASIRRPG